LTALWRPTPWTFKPGSARWSVLVVLAFDGPQTRPIAIAGSTSYNVAPTRLAYF
jgi:hypothetical protein